MMIEIRDDVAPLGLDFAFPEVVWMEWIATMGCAAVSDEPEDSEWDLVLLRTSAEFVGPFTSDDGEPLEPMPTSVSAAIAYARMNDYDGVLLVDGPDGNTKELYREYVR